MNILVVEDDRLMAETIRTIVLKIPGVKNVDTAPDYDIAMRNYVAKAYHMILVDIYLAGSRLNGLDLCHAVRKKDPNLPIIIITSDPSFGSLEIAFHSFVNDYVKKPFFPQELALRVQRWLFSRKTDNPPEEYKGISYRSTANEFFFLNQKIHLTKKNKALLLLFLKNNERILTKEFLQEKLWEDYDPFVSRRNVRSNIQLLRKSLKPIQCDRWIITVRGEGYLLRKPLNND